MGIVRRPNYLRGVEDNKKPSASIFIEPKALYSCDFFKNSRSVFVKYASYQCLVWNSFSCCNQF